MASEEENIFRDFGHQLKAARLEQARSLDDLASYTKIHRRHLEAIEAGDISLLPQGPYVKAFLREYARALGLKVPAQYSTPAPPVVPAPVDPRVVSRPAGNTGAPAASTEDSMLPLTAVAKETVRFANTAVNSAVSAVTKTTESMVKLVETGSKEALEVLTSKSLWAEADEVRRERSGLPPLQKKEATETKKIVITSSAPEVVKAPEPTAIAIPVAEASASATIAAPASSSVEASAQREGIATIDADAVTDAPPVRAVSSKGATNVVIALLVILFGGAAFYAIRMYRSESAPAGVVSKDYIPAPVDKPQVLVPTKHEPVATQPVEPTPATAVGPHDSLRFTLKATQPVWISIAPDGLPAYKGQLKAGEVKSFKAGERFIVNLGNQKAVEMNFNGQTLSGLPTIQNSGIVVRNLLLMRDHVTLGGQEVALSSAAPQQQQPTNSAAVVAPPVATPQVVPPAAHSTATPTASKNSGTTHTSSKPGTAKGSGTKPNGVKTNGTKTNGAKNAASKAPVKSPSANHSHTLKPGEIPSIDPVPPRP